MNTESCQTHHPTVSLHNLLLILDQFTSTVSCIACKSPVARTTWQPFLITSAAISLCLDTWPAAERVCHMLRHIVAYPISAAARRYTISTIRLLDYILDLSALCRQSKRNIRCISAAGGWTALIRWGVLQGRAQADQAGVALRAFTVTGTFLALAANRALLKRDRSLPLGRPKPKLMSEMVFSHTVSPSGPATVTCVKRKLIFRPGAQVSVASLLARSL